MQVIDCLDSNGAAKGGHLTPHQSMYYSNSAEYCYHWLWNSETHPGTDNF